jgi:hypothetical protein
MPVADSTIASRPLSAATDRVVSTRTSLAVVLANLFCAMLATGVPIRDGLLLTAYCMVVTAGGVAIYSWVLGRRRLTFAETLGAGFATGTVFPALTIFLVGESGYRSTTMTLLWLSVLAIAAMASILRTPLRLEVGPGSFAPLALVPLIAMFGYQAWSPLLWPYLLGFLIVLTTRFVLGLILQNSVQSRRHLDRSVLLIAPVVALLFQLFAQLLFEIRRPYLYLGWLTDNVFDEGLSWSVARYGYAENPFFRDHEVVGYLLTNAWAGDIYEFLSVSPFTVVSSFGIIASLFAVFFLTIAICERHHLASRVSIIAVVLVGLQGSFGELFPLTEPPRIQHVLTMAWLFLSVLLVEEFVERPRALTTAFICLMGTAILLGKTQMFVVLLGFLLASAIVGSFKYRRITHLVFAAASTGLLLIAFRALGDRYFSARSGQWIMFNDYETLSLWVLPLIITLISRTLIPFTLFGQLGSVGNRFGLRVAAVSFPVVMAFALSHDANALRHAVEPALILGSLAAAPFVDKMLRSTSVVFSTIALGMGLVFGLVLVAQGERAIILNFPEDSLIRLLALEHPTRAQLGYVLASSLVLLPIALTIRFVSKRRRNIALRWATLSVVGLVVVGTNTGALVSWSTRLEVRGLVALEEGDPWPDRGQRAEPHIPALNWIRANTSKEVVVANNLLCKGLPVAGFVPINGFSADCMQRNMSALVTAFGQRRSYIDGPYQAFIGAELMEAASQRYRDSILFATNNDPNSHARMIRDGVDYFVVDLGQTSLRDWEPRGTIRHVDDHYAVVELNN